MPKPRHINTREHYHHMHVIAHGTKLQSQALLAYGGKKLHDAILHTMEKARDIGAHHDLEQAPRQLVEYLGNNRINKKDRMDALQAGGSHGRNLRNFWHGFRRGFMSVWTPGTKAIKEVKELVS